ncbi:unnamed protein product [Lampetra planeri]
MRNDNRRSPDSPPPPPRQQQQHGASTSGVETRTRGTGQVTVTRDGGQELTTELTRVPARRRSDGSSSLVCRVWARRAPNADFIPKRRDAATLTDGGEGRGPHTPGCQRDV